MTSVLPKSAWRTGDRWLKARVDILLTSLPLTMVLNPVWAALSMIPLGGYFHSFGIVPLPTLMAIVGLHLFNSALVGFVLWWAKRTKAPVRTLFAVLLALQVWISTTWAAGAAVCWIDGNTTNNIFLALLVMSMMWALAITRSVHPMMLGAGLLPLMFLLWLRAATASGEAALVLTIFAPIVAAYAWFMGMSAGDRVNQVLQARFDLEDMTGALEVARNDAVTKGLIAEAASASKSAFVANMSHELRTPLNAILGFSELIERAAVGPEISQQYRNYGRDIRESGAHLLSLINDILDIAKIEAGKMEIERQLIDARTAIDVAVRLITPRADAKRQTVTVTVDPSLHVFADGRAFKQVLLNLLSNAVKFSPERGMISVRCTRLADDAVAVAVSDSGPGIPAEKIKDLFHPFSRVDNRYDGSAGGTGLGLALIRGLMAAHGGAVRVENRSLGGLVATLEFPGREQRTQAA
jgi:two-component system, cell cycle sensor histidine kinase PleC